MDRSLRVWDVRAPPSKACQITVPDAHATDVNVISWNRKDTSLIVSGADDGHLKVCDLVYQPVHRIDRGCCVIRIEQYKVNAIDYCIDKT